VRLFALHDNVRDPSSITLNSTFEDLGLNSLDLCEIYLQAEREFDTEISEEDCESFHDHCKPSKASGCQGSPKL